MKTNCYKRFRHIIKITYFIFFFILIISSLSLTRAQAISAVAGVSPEKGVIVRWFAQESFNIEGVNIYRKEKNENTWTKLNTIPVKRMEKPDPKSTDKDLLLYGTLIYDHPKKVEDMENWKLMQLTKGIMDPKFSRFFGMEYDDNSAETGKTYEYKIVRVVENKETEGSVSNPVKIENYNQGGSPENFAADEGDQSAMFNWKTDKKKFFVYNLYRSESENGNKIKINTFPIIVFSFKDKSGVSKPPKYFYTDTSLVNGKTYYYSLSGVDFLGRESALSKTLKTTPRSLAPPPAPFNVRGNVKDNKVTVTWKEAKTKDLQEFNIFRGLTKDGKYDKLNKKELLPTDTLYIDVIENPAPAYYYYVEAINTSGNSQKSPFVFVPVPDMTPPVKPEGLTGSGEIGRITLTWKMGADKNLLGYYIYRAISDKPDEFLLLTPYPVKKNDYTDTLKKEHQNIFLYQIKSVSKTYVTSVPSEIVRVHLKDVTPPGVPAITNAYFEGGTIVVEWKGNIDEDLLGYDIFKTSVLDTSKWSKLNRGIITGTTTKYVDSLSLMGSYLYALTASDTNGNVSSKSVPVRVDAVSADTTLQKVQGASGEYVKEKKIVLLSWEKIVKANLIGYMVFRIEEDAMVSVGQMTKENQYEDKEPMPGKNIYLIKAYDDAGNVSESKEIEVYIRE